MNKNVKKQFLTSTAKLDEGLCPPKKFKEDMIGHNNFGQ